MSVEASKQPENTSSQSSKNIAEGKRKGNSVGPVLSLQDVFSDPANPEGRQKKTSRPFANEQEKETQLKANKIGKKKQKTRGGRRKIPTVELRTKKLQMYMTLEEYNTFLKQYNQSGRSTMADYLRVLVLNKKSSRSMVDRVKLIRHLDFIGMQVARIGNNINQLAKYVNIQMKTGKIDHQTITRFNNQMDRYLKQHGKLTKAYRAMVKNEL